MSIPMMIRDALEALQASCLFTMLAVLLAQAARAVDLLRAIRAKLEDESWRESLREEGEDT